MTDTEAGRVYDAVTTSRILGIPIEPYAESIPVPHLLTDDEVIVYHAGWSLRELRDSAAGKLLLRQQDWYDRYRWSHERRAAGYYRVFLRVTSSNSKTFPQQEKLLQVAEIGAVALNATALLLGLLSNIGDLLNGDFTRCREQVSGGRRAYVRVVDDRVSVDYGWGSDATSRLWLSSFRKC